MALRNPLLLPAAAELERFGEGWPGRFVRALRKEAGPVGEDRAEALVAGTLGPGGRGWFESRAEF